MKTWPLLIGIIIILALVCSPVLAISKSELMAYYYRTTPESPAYPENNPIPAKVPSPICSQSCLCKRPDSGAIVPCICGAVDTSIYYEVKTTCSDQIPIPTFQIPSWYTKSRFDMKNPNLEAAEDLARENFARMYLNTFFRPPKCCDNVTIRGQII